MSDGLQAPTGFAYDVAAIDLARGDLRWSEGDFRVSLASSEYRPRQSADTSLADLGRSIVTDAVKLPSRAIDSERAGRICLRAGGVRFNKFTGEFRYAVVFNAESERLVAYSDLGPQSVTNTVIVLDYPDKDVCEFIITPDVTNG